MRTASRALALLVLLSAAGTAIAKDPPRDIPIGEDPFTRRLDDAGPANDRRLRLIHALNEARLAERGASVGGHDVGDVAVLVDDGSLVHPWDGPFDLEFSSVTFDPVGPHHYRVAAGLPSFEPPDPADTHQVV